MTKTRRWAPDLVSNAAGWARGAVVKREPSEPTADEEVASEPMLIVEQQPIAPTLTVAPLTEDAVVPEVPKAPVVPPVVVKREIDEDEAKAVVVEARAEPLAVVNPEVALAVPVPEQLEVPELSDPEFLDSLQYELLRPYTTMGFLKFYPTKQTPWAT